jgi:hypothetical protein
MHSNYAHSTSVRNANWIACLTFLSTCLIYMIIFKPIGRMKKRNVARRIKRCRFTSYLCNISCNTYILFPYENSRILEKR